MTGALSTDDSIWDNDESETTAYRDSKSPDEWKRLCYKYKAKLIDFGFARALTPGDVDENPIHPHKKNAGFRNVQDERIENSQRKKNANGLGKILRNKSMESLSNLDASGHSVASVSHKMKRVMSTLGNRNYVAPEIVNRVRRFSPQDKRKERQKDLSQKSVSESTKTISAFVADYGLLVDSYSMGHTIRYMMTGVQPGFSVEEAIKKQQRSEMVKKILSKIGFGKKKTSNKYPPVQNKIPRKPRYRSMDDIPGQAHLLIEQLTEICPHNRISIRNARRKMPWISEVLSFQTPNNHEETSENTASTPLLSLEYCSEEQLQSLYQTRYLPMATATPESVVSTLDATKSSLASSPLDGTRDTVSIDTSSDNSNPIDDQDGAIGLSLDDNMITF